MTGGEGDQRLWFIVENCSNTLILRCSASENGGTARFASKLIGEQPITESAVLPAEVEQLPDLSGYLKFASHPTWRVTGPGLVGPA